MFVYPIAMRGREDGAELEWGEDGEPAYSLRTGSGGSSKPMVAYAPDTAATLTAGVARKPGVNPPGRRQEDGYNIIAFDWQTSGSERTRPNISTERTSTSGCTNRDAVLVQPAICHSRAVELGEPGSPSYTLAGAEGGTAKRMVFLSGEGESDYYGVRRLSPTECERLQGYPDGWTATGADGKPISDAQRYRQLGNSVAIPVVSWIAKRLVEVDNR